jgi:hypothetical protein
MATTQSLSISGRAEAFKHSGSVYVGDLEADEVIALAVELRIPVDKIHLEGGRLINDEHALTLTPACSLTREQVIQEGHSIGCHECGQSVVRHRSERDPVVIGEAA